MHLIKMTGAGLSPADKGRAMFDPYALHRMVYAELCAHPDASRDFLYRQAKGASLPTVYAVSPRVPTSAAWTVQARPLRTDYNVGDRLAFQLRANLVTQRDGSGARHGVVLDAIKRGVDPSDAEQSAPVDWIRSRSDRLGFTLDDATVVNVDKVEINRRGSVIKKEVVEVAGTLTVSKPAAFSVTLRQGVGRSKAFGLGMVMVKRV